MNPINARLALSPVPSFRLTKKLDKRVYCCLSCAGKELQVPESLVDYILLHFKSADKALEDVEGIIDFYGTKLPLTVPVSERKAKKVSMQKLITGVLQNMNDIHGESIRSLRHPHYYVSDYIYFHNFGHCNKGFDDYVRRGQLMLFYTNTLFSHVVFTEFKYLMENLKERRMDQHLYLSLENVPPEKTILLNLQEVKHQTFSIASVRDSIHINFNGLRPRCFRENRTRLVVTEDSLKMLENELLEWKRSFEDEVTLIIVRYLPHLEKTSGEVYAPSAVTWLKLLKKVFGTVEDKMIFFMVNLYDFYASERTKPSPEEVDAGVVRDLELGSKIKIISVDGAVTDKEEWELIGTKTTF